MKNNFKVLPWLRALRDRNAKEEEGMTIKERLRRTRERAQPLMREFLKSHPNVKMAESPRSTVVAEKHAHYNSDTQPE